MPDRVQPDRDVSVIRGLLVLLLIPAVVIGLSGCSFIGVAPPGAFNEVNEFTAEIDPPGLGEEIAHGNAGANTPDVGPAAWFVISGDDALPSLESKLEDLGMTGHNVFDGATFWFGEVDNRERSVEVRVFEAGIDIPTPDGEIQSDAPAVYAYVQ